MPSMDVELLVVADCPHESQAAALLQTALRDVGLVGVDVTTSVIDTPQQAEQRGFTGSPTILIDGSDPFAEPGQTSSAHVSRLSPPERPHRPPRPEDAPASAQAFGRRQYQTAATNMNDNADLIERCAGRRLRALDADPSSGAGAFPAQLPVTTHGGRAALGARAQARPDAAERG